MSSCCSEPIRSGLDEKPYKRTRNFSDSAGITVSCRAPTARASRESPSSASDMLLEVSTRTATAFWRLLSDWTANAGCHKSTSTRAAVAA